ncbi:hypothetical protein BDV06DRAFT_206273 [Aspergillus oleicola]
MSSPHSDLWSDEEKSKLWQLRQEQSHLKWDDWYSQYGFQFPGRTQAALSQQFWTLNKLDAKRRSQMIRDRLTTNDQAHTTFSNHLSPLRQFKRPIDLSEQITEGPQSKELRMENQDSQSSPDGDDIEDSNRSPSFSQRTEDLLRSLRPQRAPVSPQRQRIHISSTAPAVPAQTETANACEPIDVDQAGHVLQGVKSAQDSQSQSTDEMITDPVILTKRSCKSATPGSRGNSQPAPAKQESLPNAPLSTSRPPSIEALTKAPSTKKQCIEQTVRNLARFAQIMGEEEKARGDGDNDNSALRHRVTDLEAKVATLEAKNAALEASSSTRLATMERKMEEMARDMDSKAEQAAKDAKVMDAFRHFTSLVYNPERPQPATASEDT